MRRRNQVPPGVSTSRSTGSRLSSTARASSGRRVSAASERRSDSGRPTSPGITLNSALVAGVKNRMFMSRSRNRVATSVLYRTFCRSFDVLRWRSSVSCSWLFSACSSSFSDCISSLEVSSSSLVDWYSSLTDSASSLIARCSSPDASRSRAAASRSARTVSSSRSSSATRGASPAGAPRPACAWAGASTKQTSSSVSPSLDKRCTSMSNGTERPSRTIRPPGTVTPGAAPACAACASAERSRVRRVPRAIASRSGVAWPGATRR